MALFALAWIAIGLVGSSILLYLVKIQFNSITAIDVFFASFMSITGPACLITALVMSAATFFTPSKK